ncbi:MAG TPA: enoyl-CoA hydratase/isomerase family protein [Paracoccaceae bacterium]
MSDIEIRAEGAAGRITLNRPEALNALTHEMCLALDRALRDWRDDPAVALVLIDAVGSRAFCAGGDIARLYAEGRAGNHAHGQQFWRDEYRMNLRIAEYPKPVVTLMQGFVMGGGVGIGCHARHRIVGETAQVAMPECAIGLVPDVGGSCLLARGPGHLGAYLGTTGRRMGPADAIFAGFADTFVPQSDWPALSRALIESGAPDAIGSFATAPSPAGDLPALMPQIDRHFGGATLADIARSLQSIDTDFAAHSLKALSLVSPLAAACTVEMQRRLGKAPALRDALELEYRFTHRAQQHSDFLEGIRAAIIDKDRSPHWRYDIFSVPERAVDRMLSSLGQDALNFTE